MHLEAPRRDALDGFCDDMRSSPANEQVGWAGFPRMKPAPLARSTCPTGDLFPLLCFPSNARSKMSAAFAVSRDCSRVSVGYKPSIRKADEVHNRRGTGLQKGD